MRSCTEAHVIVSTVEFGYHHLALSVHLSDVPSIPVSQRDTSQTSPFFLNQNTKRKVTMLLPQQELSTTQDPSINVANLLLG
jgi:hypothetical protein